MTDLEQKTRLARLRARVETVLGAVGFLEVHLEEATTATSFDELRLDLEQAEGWALTALEDTREVLAEVASYREALGEGRTA